VIPLSLGIETLGGVMTTLIPRNTTIPTKKSEVFSTPTDNQTSVEIQILQGERELARDNRSLGRFHLDGIPPAPRGVPQVEVTFDIDANGILHVSAKDRATGKEQSIRIEASSGLKEDEIKRMVKEAEQNATEDKTRREEIEVRNRADQRAYETEKNLKEHADKIPAELKGKLEAAVGRVREALGKEDVAELKAATEDLETLWSQAAQAMYEAASAAGDAATGTDEAAADEATPGAGKGKKPGDGAVDADFEVVN
jgi:molecular chaperone DnaK